MSRLTPDREQEIRYTAQQMITAAECIAGTDFETRPWQVIRDDSVAMLLQAAADSEAIDALRAERDALKGRIASLEDTLATLPLHARIDSLKAERDAALRALDGADQEMRRLEAWRDREIARANESDVRAVKAEAERDAALRARDEAQAELAKLQHIQTLFINSDTRYPHEWNLARRTAVAESARDAAQQVVETVRQWAERQTDPEYWHREGNTLDSLDCGKAVLALLPPVPPQER